MLKLYGVQIVVTRHYMGAEGDKLVWLRSVAAKSETEALLIAKCDPNIPANAEFFIGPHL